MTTLGLAFAAGAQSKAETLVFAVNEGATYKTGGDASKQNSKVIRDDLARLGDAALTAARMTRRPTRAAATKATPTLKQPHPHRLAFDLGGCKVRQRSARHFALDRHVGRKRRNADLAYVLAVDATVTRKRA